MKNFKNTIDCPPRADAMIQSMRSVGYDICMAIADLIDNSISAHAKNVWIGQVWDGKNTIVYVLDDGKGMSEEEILNAMRLGSISPLEIREPDDLGRFGMGLKTASFSQCKLLTVKSKTKSGSETTRCWDLDFVDKVKEWKLLNCAYPQSENILKHLNSLKSGTIVLWENLDRVVNPENQTEEEAKYDFLRKIDELDHYLGMVFHRYISKNKIRIFIKNSSQGNDHSIKISPWDPFMTNHPSTLELSNEAHTIFGKSIKIRPFVLPHISKLNSKEHENAAGLKGWNAQQGFYIYRKERLIVSGGWLDLGYKAEDHYKLARIQVDIPNNMDNEWQIDVRKATAKPPDGLRKNLLRIAKLTREKACETYRYRGKIDQRKFDIRHQFVWLKSESNDKVRYSIDKNHPLVKYFLDNLSGDKKILQKLLSIIESTVPIETIIITNSEKPDSYYKNKEDLTTAHFPIIELFEEQLEIKILKGEAIETAFNILMTIEPFSHYPELIALKEKYESKS